MNGKAFANLRKLTTFFLVNNHCYSAAFSDDDIKGIAPAAITKNCGFEEFDSVELSCDRFLDLHDSEFCFMDIPKAINATNFVIAELRDEEIGGIRFDGNKRIEYLPYKVYMQFPNLIHFKAKECSVKQIMKENFEKLSRLQKIDLSSNVIQKISGNTFKGLESLMQIKLREFFLHHFDMWLKL